MKTSSNIICYILIATLSTLFTPMDSESSESAGIVIDDTFTGQSKVLGLENSTYQILESYGKKSGSNLFHSFEHFNLKMDETANFSGASNIQNIISRVTGGSSSSIDGKISSSIQGANLFFLNPAGIMFGPNASLNISGSFHASTGDYISGLNNENQLKKFGNVQESDIFISDPVSFGFLDKDVYASIQFEGFGEMDEDTWTNYSGITGLGYNHQDTNQTISFIGGDISFLNGSYFYNEESDQLLNGSSISSLGGRVNIVSVASEGEVPLVKANDDIGGFKIGEIDDDVEFGTVLMNEKTYISTESQEQGGEIFIIGERIFLEDTTLTSKNYGNNQGGNIILQGKHINLRNGTTLTVDNSGSGQGGSIFLTGQKSLFDKAEAVTLIRSTLNAGAIPTGDDGIVGDAGKISIIADSISLLSSYRINQSIYNDSNIPDEIKQKIREIDRAYLSEELLFSAFEDKLDDDYATYRPYISSTYVGSKMDTGTSGTGNGGTIELKANEVISIEGKSAILSDSTYKTGGKGGNINIDTKILQLSGGTESGIPVGGISSQTIGTGLSGNITVNADYISIAEFAFIKTNTTGAGTGGDILLNAKTNISLLSGGMIEATSGGSGDTGSITLFTPDGTVQISGKDTDGDSSSIRSRSLSSGNGNLINIYAKSISLIYGGFIGSESTGKGNGGDVILNAIDSILLEQTDKFGYASKILTTAEYNKENPGKAGNITLSAKKITFNTGAGITASTLAKGDGGSINVTGDIITLNGSNPYGENIDGVASGIFARSEFKGEIAGSADKIKVNAKELYIEDGAVISTSTLGGGNAGDIVLNVTEKLIIKGKRSEETSSPKQSQINYQCLNDPDTNYESGIFSRSQNPHQYAGNAGIISISGDHDAAVRPSTPYIELDEYASISTATNGLGNAGDVDIKAEKLVLKKGASISSESLSSSDYFFTESDFANRTKMEMNQINFRIFSIEMTLEEASSFPTMKNDKGLTVPDISYIDIIAEDGDIGKIVVGSGEEINTFYYIFKKGWFPDNSTSMLTANSPDPEQLIETFDFFDSIPVNAQADKKSMASCQYIDIYDIAISEDGNRYEYNMKRGQMQSYAFDGANWQQLEDVNNISEILQKIGSQAEFVSIEDYVIKNSRTTSVQKFFKEGTQWKPLQSGGDAGTIKIKNTTPNVDGQLNMVGLDSQSLENEDLLNTRISTATNGGGNAGTISIQLQDIQLDNNSKISSSSNSQGNGGRAGSVLLGAGSDSLSIDDDYVKELNINTGSQVNTSTEGLGDAGNVEILAEQINLKTTGSIASSSNLLGKSGNAGTIMIKTDTLSLIDSGTTINTSTSGQGIAGNILISAKSLNMDQESTISSASNSIGKGGDAGKIVIGQSSYDERVSIGKGFYINDEGNITPDEAADEVQLSNKSTISTSSAGAGKAGNVTLNANLINVRQQSSISSANSSVAEVIYKVDSLSDRNNLNPSVGMAVEVSDAGDGKTHTYIYTGLAWEEKSQLSLSRVDSMDQLNDLSATPGDTAKVTDAGDGFSKNFIYTGQNWVEIVSDKTVQVYIANNINSTSLKDAEKGDIVEIENVQGDLLETYTYDSEKWVKIQWADIFDNQTVKAYKVSSLNEINTQRVNEGDRAEVNGVNHFIRTNGKWKDISKAGDAGKIDIVAEDEVTLFTGGSLNTEAISSGGGQISIHGKESLYLLNGLITASVQKGFGKGGDITTRSKSVLMNHSGIEANAVEGDGGAIFITTEKYIKSDESSVTATSERGNDGTVKIDAPKVDISKGLVILPTNFLDATKWVKTPCALRSGASVSRLVVEGRDAVPTALVDWQPSPQSDLKISNKPSKDKKSSKLNRPTLLESQNKMAMKSISSIKEQN